MFYRLAENEFAKTSPLFQGLDYNLVVRAVIEGPNPGRIYADDPQEPSSAFLVSAEGSYLGGRPDNDAFNRGLGDLIAESIFAGNTVKEGEDQIDIRFLPNTWEQSLDLILRGKSALEDHRLHYVCRQVQYDWQDRIPAGFTLRRIDEQLIQKPGIRDQDTALNRYAITKMKGNWGSIDLFLQKGPGFCLLHGEQAVCWCISDCVSGDACEIGIRTDPDYRRRGLATLLVAATVDDCLNQGYTQIGWHCWEGNAGSIGVAEKVGFELERSYVAYTRMFDDAYHLAEAGLARFRQERYQEAAALYKQAFALGNGVFPTPYYFEAARASAALGDYDTALGLLHDAVERGWNDMPTTWDCQEFRTLHNHQAWKSLFAQHGESLR